MKTVSENEYDKMKDIEQILRRFLRLSEEKVLRGSSWIRQNV